MSHRLTLNARQLCDLELLLSGAMAPLHGYLDEQNYQQVLQNMRLPGGEFWPMPITLDVSTETAQRLSTNDSIILEDPNGFALATLTISSIWQPDKKAEAVLLYGTDSEQHPGVHYLLHHTLAYYVGGELTPIQLPPHYDFNELRHTPEQLKQLFQQLGWQRIIGFQTRNPIHRAHFELIQRAAHAVQANLLLHPSVGKTQAGDVDYNTRVRCYQAIMHRFPASTTLLSIVPLAMRMAGPREALWHALIRKNYGCTHFIIGRDHAAPSNNSELNFYTSNAAYQLAKQYQSELGIDIVGYSEIVYSPSRHCYLSQDEIKPEDTTATLSGTELRQRLRDDTPIPEWFSFPEIIRELKRTYVPKFQRGFCLFFTGLSGAGKSTLANAVIEKLNEIGGRTITLLDGDTVRRHLSLELGFSKKDRDLNVLRIGYVASEIVKHRGICVCAVIAPYQETRQRVRDMVQATGEFVEVYVATPLDICEQRDRKGLYQQARQGLLKDFTGIDDPYQPPDNPELTINTAQEAVTQAVQTVLLKLESLGLLQ